MAEEWGKKMKRKRKKAKKNKNTNRWAYYGIFRLRF
jgi:hypothetical protein